MRKPSLIHGGCKLREPTAASCELTAYGVTPFLDCERLKL